MAELSSLAQKEVWALVEQINSAWVVGQPDRLLELFHANIAIDGGDGQRFGQGRDFCVDSYRAFCASSSIQRFQALEPQVDVYEAAAIASYRFELEYIQAGEHHLDVGRDLFVFEKVDGGWLAIWRQMSV